VAGLPNLHALEREGATGRNVVLGGRMVLARLYVGMAGRASERGMHGLGKIIAGDLQRQRLAVAKLLLEAGHAVAGEALLIGRRWSLGCRGRGHSDKREHRGRGSP
jgi:hypothetical protein